MIALQFLIAGTLLLADLFGLYAVYRLEFPEKTKVKVEILDILIGITITITAALLVGLLVFCWQAYVVINLLALCWGLYSEFTNKNVKKKEYLNVIGFFIISFFTLPLLLMFVYDKEESFK